MPLRKLLLCRHGQDEDNAEGLLNGHRDRPLTALGLEQAAAVAAKVKAEHPDVEVILASPLQRAHTTAQAIGAAVGVAVEKRGDLIERDFGVLTGKPLADIPQYAKEMLQTDKVNYFLDGEGSEDFETLRARAAGVLEAVAKDHDGKVVLLVCHGDLMKMLLGVRKGLSWRDALLHPYIANTEVLNV